MLELSLFVGVVKSMSRYYIQIEVKNYDKKRL